MKKYLKSYAIVALGSVIFALAFDWFFAPNQVAMGGITGLAQVINALVPWLSVGVLAFVLNVRCFSQAGSISAFTCWPPLSFPCW